MPKIDVFLCYLLSENNLQWLPKRSKWNFLLRCPHHNLKAGKLKHFLILKLLLIRSTTNLIYLLFNIDWQIPNWSLRDFQCVRRLVLSKSSDVLSILTEVLQLWVVLFIKHYQFVISTITYNKTLLIYSLSMTFERFSNAIVEKTNFFYLLFV